MAVAVAALIVTLVGLSASLGGAAWLLFGVRADDPRFADDGMLYPGRQQSSVLPRFIEAQRWPTMLVVMGGGLQVAGGVLSLISL